MTFVRRYLFEFRNKDSKAIKSSNNEKINHINVGFLDDQPDGFSPKDHT
jgi:hypothetical protein